jgi:hypothetical protein
MNDVLMLVFPLFSSAVCLFLQESKYAKPLPLPPSTPSPTFRSCALDQSGNIPSPIIWRVFWKSSK